MASQSQPPPTLPQTDINPGPGVPLINYIAEPWVLDAASCRQMHLQNNPYHPFAKREEYKYIQCGIKKMVMKMNCDNMLNKENTAHHFPIFNNGDRVQKLVTSMPVHQTLTEWELHTLMDMRWNDNHQRPIKYGNRDIIKSPRWLMPQRACAEHHMFALQC